MSDQDDVDEKLAQLREQGSHGNRLDRDNPQNQPGFVDELEAALDAVDDGTVNETLTFYDKRIAAIMHALDENPDRLQDVFDDLGTAYDRNDGLTNPSVSAVIRRAVRVGFQDAAPGLLDQAMQAEDNRREDTF